MTWRVQTTRETVSTIRSASAIETAMTLPARRLLHGETATAATELARPGEGVPLGFSGLGDRGQ